MQDKMTALMIIGSILKKPSIILDDNYKISMEDFSERFHKITFSALHNLVYNGAETLDPIDVDNYLNTYEKQYRIFNDNNGFEYLNECALLADLNNFNYYYGRLKKISLINSLNALGIDTKDIYDESVVDITLKEQMNEAFEKLSIDDIIDRVEGKVLQIKQDYTEDKVPEAHAGKGLRELVNEFSVTPEMGFPMQSEVLTTIARGMRLKKLYLRSAASGFGKTRLAVADACCVSVPWLYNLETKNWDNTGWDIPTLFITTELSIDEVMTQVVAYVSGVPEYVILDGKCTPEQNKIIQEAIDKIEKSNLWFVQLENFDVESITSKIREYKIKYKIQTVFFDYIFASEKLLSTVTEKTKMRLGEHSILYILTTKLKEIANKLGVFIYTATQVNNEYKSVDFADATVIRGAKSIIDKIDFGYVMMPIDKKDMESLKPIMQNGFFKEPNMCCHVYKNRRGKVSLCRLFQYVDLGTCRVEDLFMTTANYDLIPMEKTAILKAVEESETDIDELVIDENSPINPVFSF